jgi:hypothetical protein
MGTPTEVLISRAFTNAIREGNCNPQQNKAITSLIAHERGSAFGVQQDPGFVIIVQAF